MFRYLVDRWKEKDKDNRYNLKLFFIAVNIMNKKPQTLVYGCQYLYGCRWYRTRLWPLMYTVYWNVKKGIQTLLYAITKMSLMIEATILQTNMKDNLIKIFERRLILACAICIFRDYRNEKRNQLWAEYRV